MAVNAKAVKSRIKSVKNTKKITKAMEMVSAAKMRKAIEAAIGARQYAQFAAGLMDRIGELSEPNFPLLQKRSVQNVLLVVVSSNRGLCGSFNSNILKAANKLYNSKQDLAMHRDEDSPAPSDNVNLKVLGIGKKSALFAKKHNLELVGVYEDLFDKPDIDQVSPISNQIIEGFTKGEYDKVAVVYTNFISSLKQTPKVRQLLPVSKSDLDIMINELPESEGEVKQEDTLPIDCYFLEPGQDEILESVVPRLVEVALFQALLESAASEHSSRMIAMKNASEAAGEMIDNLTLVYNKARQAAITQEIAEIAGGAAALE